MRLEDLETFLKVADVGSFTAVAAQLGIPKSTVSRRVARLERDLGVTLFLRESEGSRLTPAGQDARSDGLRVMSEVACLRGEGPRPPSVLRVVAMPELATTSGFLALLQRYRALHPEVVCDVQCSARRVDLLRERVDVVFRMHLSPLRGSSSLKARGLGTLRGGVYASPEWIAGNPAIDVPADLARVRVLTLSGGSLRHRWPLESADAPAVDVPVRAALWGSELPWLQAAAEAGHGPTILPETMAECAVKAGRLVRLLPHWSTPTVRVSVIWLSLGPESERVRGLLDLVPPLQDLLTGE